MALATALANAANPADARSRNVESFDVVWETVREKHWDAAFNGVDWEAARAELRPKVAAAATVAEAREVIAGLLRRLGQSHFSIIPTDAYSEDDLDDARRGDGYSGLAVRVLDGDAVVVRVEEGSPAASAGIRPGWIVLRVDGQELAPVVERARKAHPSRLTQFYSSRAVERRLGGRVGEERRVTLRAADAREIELTLALAEEPGERSRLGNLPAQRVRFESKTLPGNIGYIRFNLFMAPTMLAPRFEQAIREFEGTRGLVIDLRGNPGGIIGLAMGMAGWFVEEQTQLGTLITRDSRLNALVVPRTKRYDGPLAILVDECSLSTSEVFAGGMKDLGRARIFGAQTGGAALPSTIIRLPNGDGFQFAIANYVSQGGRTLEGAGVTPDELAPATRAALLRGQDPPLDAALRWIAGGAAAAP